MWYIAQQASMFVVCSDFCQYFTTPDGWCCPCTSTPGISPGRITDLRMKKLHELRELQGLLEQNVLNQEEFDEQKRLVLDSLRKLTH